MDDKRPNSKFDVSITFASTDDATCAMYHKHFRGVSHVRVEKIDPLQGQDCLILPMPSCFGLYSARTGLVHDMLQYVNSLELSFPVSTSHSSLGN